MTLLLIFCLVATVVPVFFARLSAAPGWLSLQARRPPRCIRDTAAPIIR